MSQVDAVRAQLRPQEATSRGLLISGRGRRGQMSSNYLEHPRGRKHPRHGHIQPVLLVSPTEVCPPPALPRVLEKTPGEDIPSSGGFVPPAGCTFWTLSLGDLGGLRGGSLRGQRRFCVGLRPHGSTMGNHGLTNPGLAGVIPVAKATAAWKLQQRALQQLSPSPHTAKKRSVFPGEAGKKASRATEAQKPWVLCRGKGCKLIPLLPAVPGGPTHSSAGTTSSQVQMIVLLHAPELLRVLTS